MQKNLILIVALIGVVGAIWYLDSRKTAPQDFSTVEVTPRQEITTDNDIDNEDNTSVASAVVNKAEKYELAKEITTPDGFINTVGEPITISELIGKKVILVDFWTYSCINCQRTTPYLNEWYRKYSDQGLEIIGLHTPEFEFEKDYDNVLTAVEKFGIKFPVVLDNDYSTWTAYRNRYWPRKYLIDIDGYIVYDHIGEGFYEETEREIQRLLNERKQVLGEDIDIAQDVAQIKAQELQHRSPETYFGSLRNNLFANGIAGLAGLQTLVAPDDVLANRLYLIGKWLFTGENAQNQNAGAKIIYQYNAKNVFLVAQSDTPVTITVKRDGEVIGADAGSDVIGGQVTIKEPKLYKLIEAETVGDHLLEIEVNGSGLEAFAFTFG